MTYPPTSHLIGTDVSGEWVSGVRHLSEKLHCNNTINVKVYVYDSLFENLTSTSYTVRNILQDITYYHVSTQLLISWMTMIVSITLKM